MKSADNRGIRGWLVVVTVLILGSLAPAIPAAAQTVAGVTGLDAFGLPWTPPATAYRIKVDPLTSYSQSYCVDEGGLYALTYTALVAAGLPVDTLDPRSLQLFSMGQEVPIRVLGEADGVFNTTDVVLFYGRTVDSLHLDGILPTNKYTGTNIYWLSYGGSSGARMAEVSGTIGTGGAPAPFLHREHLVKSTSYQSAYPFEYDADHWFADAQNPSTRTHDTYSFDAYNLAADLSGTLTLRLLGWSNAAHQLLVWINGAPLITSSPGWTGFTFYETTVAVPRVNLIEGANQLKVGIGTPVGAPSDQVYLDWWDLTYHDTYQAENNVLAFNNAAAGTWRYDIGNFTATDIEVYDVTDPFAPKRFINTTVSATAPYSVSFDGTGSGGEKYLALTSAAWRTPTAIEAVSYPASTYRPADLRDAANSADYILISPRDFWSQAETLVSYRDREFRAVLVDVQQIYDQFNGGMMSAEAIRDFLAYAHANWSVPAPAYVLLMGDGTNDMRQYVTLHKTYIPPYLYLADPDLGETAADNRFVTFIGADNIPDMHIGRFPVNDVTQAQAMVDKTMRYEISCQCDADNPNDPLDIPWQKNTVFVADDLEGGGGDFYYYSDEIADGYVDTPANTIKLIPQDYTVQKEYLGLTCDLGNPKDAAQCRANLVNTQNGTGALFISYVGHATKPAWAGENIWDVPTINGPLLTNGPCLPIMLAMTCYEGSFHDYETPDTVAEDGVRKTTSGAVASFSPTGFGLVSGHDYLERGLMLAWFHDGVTRLGASITYAKQYLADHAPVGSYLDLLDTFLLLGDPALRVKTADACLAPTAVEMAGFAVQPAQGGAQITWQTADESHILGFNVLRRIANMGRSATAGPYSAVNTELIPAAYMGLVQGNSYSYRDTDVRSGETYRYQIEIIKLDGASEFYGSSEFGTVGLQLREPPTQ